MNKFICYRLNSINSKISLEEHNLSKKVYFLIQLKNIDLVI